jgi:hypothetical protein
LIKTLTTAAIRNDMRAMNALLGCLRFFGIGAEEQVLETIDLENIDLLEEYVAQQRKQQNRTTAEVESDSKNPSDDT